MSSLAATQADGYYIPAKHFDNDKRIQRKSKNEIAANEKPSGKKSGGHNQFLQRNVCRFEIPYRGTCQGCQQPIMKGTRFNAHKAKVDAYFSTPIYEFRMKCPSCKDMEFVVRTNPKEQSFDYTSGISKRLLEPLEGEADHGYVVVSDGHGATSVLDRLDRHAASKRKALSEREHLEELMRQSEACYQNDSSRNASLRDSYRVVRRKHKRQRKAGKAAGWREGMELLSDDRTSDVVLAKSVTFRSREGDVLRSKRESSIFSSSGRKMKKRRRGLHDKAGTKEESIITPEVVTSNDTLQSASSNSTGTHSSDLGSSSNRKKRTMKLLLESDGRISQSRAPTQDEARPKIACLALYGSDSDVDSE